MTIAAAQARPRLSAARRQAYDWLVSLPVLAKVALAVGMACVTGLAARLEFPLPGTTVPFTMQTFTVLVTGLLLGGVWGGLSQTVYVSAGLAGVPWFSGGAAGLTARTIAHMGYLAGFVVAASLVGAVVRRCNGRIGFVRLFGLMAAGAAVILLLGGLHLAVLPGFGLARAYLLGVRPFLFPDLVKAAMATGLGCMLLPGASKAETTGQ